MNKIFKKLVGEKIFCHTTHKFVELSAFITYFQSFSTFIFLPLRYLSKKNSLCRKKMKQTFLFCLILLLASTINAQETSPQPAKPGIKFNPFDGIIVGGYVDKGAFLNFTGPNIALTIKNSKFILGMLPSLRYKEDNGIFRNSPIMPGLGCGFTYCYKQIAIQVPLYYNTKTATTNGRWNVGIGIGMRLKSK